MDTENERPAEPDNGDAAAAAAWESIKRGQDWESWKTIARRFNEGRTYAMHKAMTNQPVGKNYNRAMNEWLNDPKRIAWTLEIDRTTRNEALWCFENLAALDKWRDGLTVSERVKTNHPRTLKKNYEKINVEKAIQRAERKKQVKIDADELDRLNADLARYKKQAEADGSLFDLRKDPIADIAHCIAGNMSDYRLRELQKALKAEADRARAIKKQAG